MKRVLLTALITLLVLPAAASAQRKMSYNRGNSFSFSPFAGAFKDAMDISADDENTGYMLGFRVGYDLSRRGRVVGEISYAQSDDVAFTQPGTLNFNVYDNNWIMTTGGLEYDIIPGPTSITLAAQAGAGWRSVSLDETIGFPTPTDESSGYVAQFIVLPRISARHQFSPRTALEISVMDHILTEGTSDRIGHSPALVAGFSFR